MAEEELKTVMPGDLITADQWNLMISTLLSLIGRVDVLEASAPAGDEPIITEILPLGDIEMGSEIKIIGKNFGLASLATVTIKGVLQDIKEGSTDSLLLLDVTGIINLPGDGIVTLIVSNEQGVASRNVKVVPAEVKVLTADLLVAAPVPPLVALASPGDYVFNFPLHAETSVAASYTLTPSVTPAVSSAGWNAIMVNQEGNPAPTEIEIPKSPSTSPANMDLRVKVTVPAGVPADTNFQVGVDITSKTDPPRTGTRFANFKTGAVATPSNPDIQITLDEVFPASAGTDAGLNIKPDTTKKVTATFKVTVQSSAQHTVITPITVEGPAANRFTVTLKSPLSFIPGEANGIKSGKVIVDIKGSAGANVDGTLVIKVKKDSDPTNPGVIEHPLHIKP